ncbi:MAG TPA: VCBS repeat-containing protein, partial [Methanocella sp.]|nr:VCBS repeat-containing protein [Methanocella sp.]
MTVLVLAMFLLTSLSFFASHTKSGSAVKVAMAARDGRTDYFEALSYGDFNMDGDPEFVTSSAAQGLVRVWVNDNGDLGSPPPVGNIGAITRGLVTADMNQDGWPDFVLGSQNGEIGIGNNFKNGTYNITIIDTAPAGIASLGVADIDLDGDLDIVAAGTGGALRVVENKGGGVFSGSDVLTIPSGGATVLRLADMNLDGKTDAVIATDTGAVYIALGTGGLTFGPATSIGQTASGSIVEMKLADVERDGDVDIITGDASGKVYLFKNNRGSYSKTLIGSYTTAVTAMETTDLDYDGDQDILVGSET